MADDAIIVKSKTGESLYRKLKDLGDGTYADAVSLTGSNAQQAINEQVAFEGVPGSASLVAEKEVSIINNGPGNILVNFDADTMAAGAFTVRAGQAWTGPRACTVLHWRAETETIFTAVGV